MLYYSLLHKPQVKIWDNKQNNIMTSRTRKRNKGKERKELEAEISALRRHEAEKERESRAVLRKTWHGWAGGLDVHGQFIQCNHGVALIRGDNHPVTSFVDSFYINAVFNNEIGIMDNLKELFQAHREVWDNENYRKMVINIFIAIGTNSMLALSNENPKNIAYAIVTLENYDGSGDFDSVDYNCVSASKMRDLLDSSTSRRDMLKFFRKRTSCKCLKAMHLEARKTLPKLGECYHCKEKKERALLMVCSRCRIAQYCSRKCQVANFSGHKGHCKECVSVHKQQQAKKR